MDLEDGLSAAESTIQSEKRVLVIVLYSNESL